MSGMSPSIAPLAITLHRRSRELEMAFTDGSVVRLAFELMRVFSPSAEVQGHAPDQSVLQTGHRLVLIEDVELVGHYGIRPKFSDGHHTGIFAWDYLLRLSSERDQLWSAYESRLKAAGASRDAGAPQQASVGCKGERSK